MHSSTRTRVLTRAGLSVGAALTASVLALTLVAAGVGSAGAAPRALEHTRAHHDHDAQGLRGRVSAVSATSLTISNDGKSSTFTLNAQTTFMKNGLAIPASDITVGSRVLVALSSTTTTPPTASSVALLASPEVRMGHGVEGTVYSVTPTSIVITHDGWQKTFVIDANTVVVMNGVPATLANVTVGARVRVALSTSATTPTASAIMVFANEAQNTSAVSGSVVAYVAGVSITVAGASGPVTFVINPATIITKDHVVLLASDITVGSMVRVIPTATTTPLTAGIISLEN
ncbi:MAG TPA: DUF5666 domain-containing protein [Acidimicrobiales bacterium]|nr:DUF5666 domain-containing protein [Acidimicrobiales bacterium]